MAVFGVVAIAFAAAQGPSIARADDSAAAQALFDQGKKAMASKDFAVACPKFEESYRLDPAMGTLLNLADCYERVGRLASAWSKYLELASKAHSAGQSDRARIGRQRAAALASRLSNLVIQTPAADRTPGLEIKRDGTTVGQAEWGATIPADPGSHTIDASAPGRLPWSTTIDVGGHASTATVVVPELQPAPVEAPPPEPVREASAPATHALPSTPPEEHHSHGLGTQKVLSLVAGGVGLAGIGVGTYFGLTSIGKHGQVVGGDMCSGTTCPAGPGINDSNDARNAGTISTVAFAIGAAGVAGALALWFTAPSPEGSTVAVGVGPAAVQVNGTW